MIKKLRKKLVVMFLSFTMLAFTIMELLMVGNTVARVQESEMIFVGNMCDSIIEQIKDGVGINDPNLLSYVTKFHGWVYISDGISEISSVESFVTSSDILIKQMKSGNMLLSTTVESNANIEMATRTIYLISETQNEKYCGVNDAFQASGTEYNLILIVPQSTPWEIIKSYCSWYPLVWLGMLLLMYFMSRILIGKAVEPVEATIKSQKRFIAAASHELKAPLSVIQANTETLCIDQATASQKKQKVVLDECGRMSTLIQSMLRLASSDTGSWKMSMKETDVDSLLIEAWEAFQESARKKNIRIELNIEEHYPKFVGDKEHIGTVLGILIDNAISYSMPDLSIEMGAEVQQKQIVFFVTDHGAGISNSEKEKVFERFYRADPSRNSKEHFGLGLCIAKEIVQLHQGTITLEDTPGGGCTFKVKLPINQ
ncbi:sensor histidine kinase [Lutispora saccharofermentans]|uniref:histidine kinase n=1 Tax=Lutispora saccharofermentans TaxID=3024236 RepID=A0ABT1NJT6_9FIRM|nr:HAMP domain-containing histidine kinase [Lutispora saccharofermentans]